MPSDQRCGTCRWWAPLPNDLRERGKCFAPIPKSEQSQPYRRVTYKGESDDCPCYHPKETNDGKPQDPA